MVFICYHYSFVFYVIDTNDENDILTSMDTQTGNKLPSGLKEARLHQSLAHVSSEIDSKQRLIAELQSKAAELDHLKNHYERQMTSLQWRIKETEHERDSVMANLSQIEHTGEERLKRTREEFEKKLSALQVSSYLKCIYNSFMYNFIVHS